MNGGRKHLWRMILFYSLKKYILLMSIERMKSLYPNLITMIMRFMAKRRKSNSKTVYRTKTVKSYVKSATSKAGGLISGLVAGAGGQVLSKYAPLGAWSQPVADIVTGSFIMKNETLNTIGGRSIGMMLASGINTNGSGSSGSLVG